MTRTIRKHLTDIGVRTMLDLGRSLDWSGSGAASLATAVEAGWVDEGDGLIGLEDQLGSIHESSDGTDSVSISHTTWASGVDTTAAEPVERIAHVIAVIREHLGFGPEAIRLDTGKFAARWVLDDDRRIKCCSPTLTAAESFRVEQPHKYAQYLGG